MGPTRIRVPNVQLREHRLRLNLTLEEVAEALIALRRSSHTLASTAAASWCGHRLGRWERSASPSSPPTR
jgi:hypothetical protein